MRGMRWAWWRCAAALCLGLAACEGGSGEAAAPQNLAGAEPDGASGGALDTGMTASVATGPTGADRLPVPSIAEGETYEVELGDSTDFIDGSDDIDSVAFDGATGVVTLKARAGKVLGFKPGRVLLSKERRIARKITAVSQSGDVMTLQTDKATLTDVFKKLRINADVRNPEAPAGKPGVKRGALIDADGTASCLPRGRSRGPGERTWRLLRRSSGGALRPAVARPRSASRPATTTGATWSRSAFCPARRSTPG